MLLLADPPNEPPNINSIQPVSSTSFMINWTPQDPNYNYQISLINLRNSDQNRNKTVSAGESPVLVTGLSGDANYNVSVAAVNECGMNESNSATVYGEFLRCIATCLF